MLGALVFAPVLYLVTLPGARGRPAFIAEFVLSGLFTGVVLYAANHRLLDRFNPIFVALFPMVCFRTGVFDRRL